MQCLIKNAGLHLSCSANSVTSDTLHLNPVDSWLDLLKNLGWRKSHAESKIDLGLYSEGKMKGIQSYRSPSHVSLQHQYFPCVLPMCAPEFSTCEVNIEPGRKAKGRREQSNPANILWFLESVFVLFCGWKTTVRDSFQKRMQIEM